MEDNGETQNSTERLNFCLTSNFFFELASTMQIFLSQEKKSVIMCSVMLYSNTQTIEEY